MKNEEYKDLIWEIMVYCYVFFEAYTQILNFYKTHSDVHSCSEAAGFWRRLERDKSHRERGSPRERCSERFEDYGNFQVVSVHDKVITKTSLFQSRSSISQDFSKSESTAAHLWYKYSSKTGDFSF